MIYRMCEYCSKGFYVRPYRANTARCCSRKCLWHVTKKDREFKRIQAIIGRSPSNCANLRKKCLICGIYFQLSPSRLSTKFYCSRRCYGISQRINNPYKYIRITVNGIRYLEHRYIVEQKLGRKLCRSEHVDHINRIKSDNRESNLRVLSDVEHGKLTRKQRLIPIWSYDSKKFELNNKIEKRND